MKIKKLKYYDIIILTLIMFFYAIYTSTISYLSLNTFKDIDLSFSSKDNYNALIIQFLLLCISFIYLKLRNFDFSIFKIKINLKSLLKGIFLFIFISLLYDLYIYLINYIFFNYYKINYGGNSFLNLLKSVDFSIIIYSLFNGFYEEIFFLGMCCSVDNKYRYYILIYSLIIRYSFHTYQGNISAIFIGFILGLIFYFGYILNKKQNLFIFFIAHSLADIIGISILYYI